MTRAMAAFISLSLLALAAFAGTFLLSRRWINTPQRDPGVKAGTLERRRTLQKVALGAFSFVLVINVLQLTVGDEDLDGLEIFVLVMILASAAALVHELRNPLPGD